MQIASQNERYKSSNQVQSRNKLTKSYISQNISNLSHLIEDTVKEQEKEIDSSYTDFEDNPPNFKVRRSFLIL